MSVGVLPRPHYCNMGPKQRVQRTDAELKEVELIMKMLQEDDNQHFRIEEDRRREILRCNPDVFSRYSAGRVASYVDHGVPFEPGQLEGE